MRNIQALVWSLLKYWPVEMNVFITIMAFLCPSRKSVVYLEVNSVREKPRLSGQSWNPSSFTSKLCCFSQIIQSLHRPVSLCVKYPSQKALVKVERETVPRYLGHLWYSRNLPLNHTLEYSTIIFITISVQFESVFY